MYFDKKDVPLSNVIRKGFFVIDSRIEDISQINLILYHKKGYDGIIGEQVILKDIVLKKENIYY